MVTLVVAIDGPAGSGKSTVSRGVAERLGIAHLDTGGYYRAATLAVLQASVEHDAEDRVVDVVEDAVIGPENGLMTLDGEIVEHAIRGPEVTAALSAVSAIPRVRAAMVRAQRNWVNDHGGKAVVEGRDIGTVVFPDADVKVYLTADPAERARRRAVERGEDPIDHLEAIERRDAHDSSREASPLRPAEDAVILDTTNLSIEQVIDRMDRRADTPRSSLSASTGVASVVQPLLISERASVAVHSRSLSR